MIKKLSDSWRQQKQGLPDHNQDLLFSKIQNKNPEQPIDNFQIISPVISDKVKKKAEISGISLVDWDCGDSILLNVNKECDKSFYSNLHVESSFSHTIKHKNATDLVCIQNEASFLHNNTSCSLLDFDLPTTVIEKYKKNGIESLFLWQKECLLTGKALEGGNLVYSAPTSAGKTLVAELLMLKRVLKTRKKVIYILPFVSVAREKVYSLRDQFEDSGITIGGFMGNENTAGGLNTVDIAVCTIEKANSLINKLMESKKILDLCCVVVDEMHMIGDVGRGYLLELLLTKIKFLTASNDAEIQIIGMSATLPNLDMLAKWLKADLYFTNFRPVPLTEHIKVGNHILNSSGKEVSIVSNYGGIKGDEEGIIPLCVETIVEGNSVLIFCPTKNWCEKLSETISEYFLQNPMGISFKTSSESNHKKSGFPLISKVLIEDVIEQLQRTQVGLDKMLEKVVRQGVAYHHAGLTIDERDILEGAFRRGVLRILVATSTLSSGVNLPARRVIIRSPIFHGQLLEPMVYKQMAGRAGRKNVDSEGESILICKPTEKQKGLSLLTSDLVPVYSCLLHGEGNSKTLKRALLEVIAAGVASQPEHVQLYAQSTYLHVCLSAISDKDPDQSISDTMKFLIDNEFIRLEKVNNEQEENYFATQLGSATLASSLSPDEALLVLGELREARKRFVLENELHIIYQVTPIYLQDQWPELDWQIYYNIWEKLPAEFKAVGELVGVQERFLARAFRNGVQQKNENQMRVLRIHKRFYAALILQDLVNEVPLSHVSNRYKINRGLLQSLQNSASTFAGMVTVFCQKLGWSCLELLLEQFQSRLSFGVSRELCNLVRIPLLSGFMARTFYEKGYQTVSTLVSASVEDIARILRDAIPFESKKSLNKLSSQSKRRRNARNICLVGQEGLTDQHAACLIIAEAKRILAADAALLGIPIDKILDIQSSFTKNGKRSPCSNSSPKITPKSSIKRSNKKRNHSFEESFEKRSKRVFCIERAEVTENVEHVKECVQITSNQEVRPTEIFKQCQLNTMVKNADHTLTSISSPNLIIQFEEKNSLLDYSPCLINTPKEEVTNLVGEKLLDKPLIGSSENLLISDENVTCSPIDFSLRISSSDNTIENVMLVPPLQLIDKFEEALVSSSSTPLCIESKNSRNKNCDEEFAMDSLCGLTFNEAISVDFQKNRTLVESQGKDFLIIDVGSDKVLFQTFLKEWKQQTRFSLCLACENVTEDSCKGIRKEKKIKYTQLEPKYPSCSNVNPEKIITGVAVCWGSKDAFFLNLGSSEYTGNNFHYAKDRISAFKHLLKSKTQCQLIAFDIKEQLKLLYQLVGSLLNPINLLDPKVAHWMLCPNEREKNLYALANQFLNKEFIGFIEGTGYFRGTGGLGQGIDLRTCACIEAVTVYHLMEEMELRLKREDLIKSFVDIEMPTIRTLLVIEINGIGFSDIECEKLKEILKGKLDSIQQECYKLSGSVFSLSSPADVARVLFTELNLPPGGEYNLNHQRQMRSKVTGKKLKSICTSKEVLEKLSKFHALPKLILEWRKINSTLTKFVYPVQRRKRSSDVLQMHRIFTEAIYRTCTGRVTFSEPNLQNVPKEFDIKLSSLVVKSPPHQITGNKKHKRQLVSSTRPLLSQQKDKHIGSSTTEMFTVSMRSTFVPFSSGVMVAADYEQLELRIIAHMSQDQILIKTLNESGDVFKSIAAEINHINVVDVTTVQRQHAKQICYGIIYGIGIKALSHQLGVEENDASEYMEKFKNRFKGVKRFIQNTIEEARANGFVKTLGGRKRYLPAINSKITNDKSHAERQAVNTTIQGSAADLVKIAMNNIDIKLNEIFGNSCFNKLAEKSQPKGAYLVLQIHDELLYEVNKENVDIVIKLIRREMESAIILSVKMPVKVKIGSSWGTLKDI
ncbi:DNA polymerase theta isoform X1 [Hydra vulgaris]|uniref:DNA polymerase theta isoform X1 n=1 Tax=Hydra vulgaris TaxID=6087 RepID=UPI001F5F50B0|nr:DNA polymerase theta isoform X1 [Hydra vulgaris]XP_047125531.1 DNA polymerase theta isoform X1 [Hydra vulgaris]